MGQAHNDREGRRALWTGLVLGLLLLRAYVPAGFMPASGQPFALEICPDGLDGQMPTAQMAHVHHPGMVMPAMPMHDSSDTTHHGSHEHFSHCPFGSLPASGPLAASIGIEPAAVSATTLSATALPLRLYAKRDRAHLPRGPPSSA